MPAYWGGTNCTTSTTSTTTSGNYVWYTVVTSTAGTASCTAPTYYYNHPRYYSTPAYYDDPHARQAAVTQSHAEAAKKRALELLIEHLSPEQKKTFEEKKWFVVEGGRSKTQYRIRAQDHLIANIDVMEAGRTKHKLCGHCDIRKVPLGDQLLAQKMMLEFSEDDFLKVANRHAA
jgi:hypothetical protein